MVGVQESEVGAWVCARAGVGVRAGVLGASVVGISVEACAEAVSSGVGVEGVLQE